MIKLFPPSVVNSNQREDQTAKMSGRNKSSSGRAKTESEKALSKRKESDKKNTQIADDGPQVEPKTVWLRQPPVRGED
jgi:hypothetical protein